jgi:hypothetical protein
MTPSLKKHLAESEKQLLSLRHEYKIFMGAVANWFESHPDLTGGTVGKPKCVHSVRSRLKNGSERESVKPHILGCILQNHEFGPAGRHVLGLEQQVA